MRSKGSRRPVTGRCGGLWPLDESSQITPGSYTELGEDLVQVAFHRADRHTHFQGDVTVGRPAAGQPCNLALPGSQR